MSATWPGVRQNVDAYPFQDLAHNIATPPDRNHDGDDDGGGDDDDDEDPSMAQFRGRGGGAP